MLRSRTLCSLLTIFAVAAPLALLSGCGESQNTGLSDTKVEPVKNPAPGVVPLEDEYKSGTAGVPAK